MIPPVLLRWAHFFSFVLSCCPFYPRTRAATPFCPPAPVDGCAHTAPRAQRRGKRAGRRRGCRGSRAQGGQSGAAINAHSLWPLCSASWKSGVESIEPKLGRLPQQAEPSPPPHAQMCTRSTAGPKSEQEGSETPAKNRTTKTIKQEEGRAAFLS